MGNHCRGRTTERGNLISVTGNVKLSRQRIGARRCNGDRLGRGVSRCGNHERTRHLTGCNGHLDAGVVTPVAEVLRYTTIPPEGAKLSRNTAQEVVVPAATLFEPHIRDDIGAVFVD